MAGSEWRLVEEGKRADAPGGHEPRFSTWDEALGKKQAQQSQQEDGAPQASSSAAGSAPDLTYYRWGSLPLAAALGLSQCR